MCQQRTTRPIPDRHRYNTIPSPEGGNNVPTWHHHDRLSCHRTRGTSIQNPWYSCNCDLSETVRVRILPSVCRRGFRVVVCRSGILFPYQQNTRCLKGGFRILGYPGSAIPYRVASHPHESIPSLHFRHLATTASSWFGLTICTVSLSVLRYFSSFRQSRHIRNFCHPPPPLSYMSNVFCALDN